MQIKLKDFKPRQYQETIFNTAVSANTLVVLPTGLGKTAIALMLAIQRLNVYPNSKIVFFAPTKPLVDQHYNTFKELLDLSEDNFAIFTGTINPKKRAELWENAKIFFSTPQGFENDIISGRISFNDVSLVIFDESHRAVKDYSYVYLASEYHRQAINERILALTASPGTKDEVVTEVLNNLFIESIEVKETSDSDILPYIQETNIEQIKVELSEEIKKLQKSLRDCYNSKLKSVKNLGYLSGSIVSYSKTDLLKLQSSLFVKISQDKSFELLKSISLVAEAGKIQHAVELVETQSIFAANEYLKKLEQESLTSKAKAVKNLVSDPNFRIARMQAESLLIKGIEHPKLKKLQSLAKLYTEANKGSKIIIFTQFRDSASRIKEFLDNINVASEVFFGQAKKKGIGHSQKKQKQTIQDFKDNKFSVLIATSVAEEGLDIPSVDLVVFYETIPSAIRTVQRRGRTGRHNEGRIILLITKDTRDEVFRWVSHHKEKQMYKIMKNVKKRFALRIKPEMKLTCTNEIWHTKNQRFLSSFSRDLEHLKIFIDHREKGNDVVRKLHSAGVSINLETLSVGDFLLSEKTIVEFKLVEDFVGSILDKRLFEQAKKLKSLYENKIIVVQGTNDIYSVRRVHPNAIRGALASLLLNYSISIIYTKDAEETAELLIALAKREQEDNKNKMVMHSAKPLTLKQQQEFVVSAFPGVGSILNVPLLNKFKSLKNIVNADEKELTNVDLIGKIKAKRLFDLFNKEY